MAIDEDGLLVDVDVQPIEPPPSTREDKCQDVDCFFHVPTTKVVSGKAKIYRACRLCP